MSNKLKIVIVGIVISVLGVVLFFTTGQREQERMYAEYLPADTLMTVRFSNINTMTDQFGASALGQLLSKESMGMILTELNMSHEIESYAKVYDDFVEVVNNPAFRTVFGDDTTLAFLRPDARNLLSNTPQELERSMVAFATTAVSGAIDTFARLIASENISKEVVGGVEMTKIQMDAATEIYTVADGGLLILSYDPETLVNIMAVHEGQARLAESVPFLEAGETWQSDPGATLYGRSFLNIGVFQALLSELQHKQAGEYGELLKGISWMSSTAQEKGRQLYFESTLKYDYDKIHPVMKHIITTQAEQNDTLHLIGKTCLVYEWASTLSPEVLFYSMGEQDLRQADSILVREIGFTVREIFNIIGPQYGFVINDIVNSGFLPVPKLVVFTEIRDQAAGMKLLDAIREKINSSGLAGEQQLTVGEHTIYYWSVLPGEATQLAIVLTPEMIYAANGKTALANILNSATGGRLSDEVASNLGPDLRAGMEGARLGSALVYPQRLAREMQPIAEWIFTTVAATQGVSVSTLGQKLLDIMRSCEIMMITSDMTRDTGTWKTIIRRQEQSQEK